MQEKKENLTPKQKERKLHIEVVRQMLTLATSGLGLVAALAWNSLIQEFVNSYIKTLLPQSGILSLFIYALFITSLAVAVTLQLSRLVHRLENLEEEEDKEKEAKLAQNVSK